MKVVSDRAALLDAVNLVSGVVASRTPRPQLTCVKMTAEQHDDHPQGALTLAGADGELSLRLTTANVDVQEPGETLIPADKLRQIVAAEDAEPTLTLAAKDDALEVRGADARFNIYGYPVADYPPPPEFPPTGDAAQEPIVIRCGALRTLATRTIFATARETSRYAINGVLLSAAGKKLEVVATDGRRLSVAKGSADSAASETAIRCILPTKALNQALKLIVDDQEPVRIAVTESQALLAFGDPEQPPRAVLATSLVEGTFPPYEEVIPKDQDKKAAFEVGRLLSAVRRAALLTNEDSRGVKLSFAPPEDGGLIRSLKLTSRAAEMGEAEVNVDVVSYEGDEIEIGFNPSFLTDVLKVVEDEQITLELKAPNKPGVIRSGPDFLYVVMPVNLQ